MSNAEVHSLRKSTGCGAVECKRALKLCGNNEGVAYEYLRLKSQAVCRKKLEHGKVVPWRTEDYVSEAKRRYFDSVIHRGQ